MKDDEILKLYLLGTLDEEQADNLEQRLLRESDLFELAEAVEGDLLAAAARRELAPAERGRVLRRLASSPQGRARYALVRGLVSHRKERVPAEVVAFQLLSRPWGRAAVAAAGMAFVVGGLWLATLMGVSDAVLVDIGRPAVSAAGPQSPAPAVPPADRIAQHAPVPAPSPAPPENRTRPEPDPWVIQLALSTLRGPGEESRPLVIPRDRQRVEIRLPLLPGEPSTSFAAILRNASTGEEIRRAERLAAQEVDGQDMVILSVPAADLVPGTYEVEVRGIENEEDQLLGKPTFEVASN
jgi:hypothetical protein